jgi:hypothetical protein
VGDFTVQHRRTEDQIKQAWRDLLASLSPEERLRGLSLEERLEGLSLEERLEGLSPEELEHLRQLLQAQAKADNASHPDTPTR